jgi:hypothetical protein
MNWQMIREFSCSADWLLLTASKPELNKLPFSVTIMIDFRLGKGDLPKIVSSAADYNVNSNSLR